MFSRCTSSRLKIRQCYIRRCNLTWDKKLWKWSKPRLENVSHIAEKDIIKSKRCLLLFPHNEFSVSHTWTIANNCPQDPFTSKWAHCTNTHKVWLLHDSVVNCHILTSETTKSPTIYMCKSWGGLARCLSNVLTKSTFTVKFPSSKNALIF